jgi:hypothetical protein
MKPFKLILCIVAVTVSLNWYLQQRTLTTNQYWFDSSNGISFLPQPSSLPEKPFFNDDDNRSTNIRSNSNVKATEIILESERASSFSTKKSLLSEILSSATHPSSPLPLQPFKAARTTPQVHAPHHAPFPRWADPRGINLLWIVEFVELFLSRQFKWPPPNERTTFIPEMPYIISANGITTSHTLRKLHRQGVLHHRVDTSEALYIQAWNLWKQSPHRWPNLTRALSTHAHSFPILVWYSDFRDCNQDNWQHGNHTYSLPLFTTCAQVNCQYAWPQPTFETILDSKSTTEWDTVFQAQAQEYPWQEKRKQVVWRGTLTGSLEGGPWNNARWNVARLAHTSPSPYWDIGLRNIPPLDPDEVLNISDISLRRVFPSHKDVVLDLSEVGGLKDSIPRTAFAHYRAVLDVDGNSWSARFGRLLCDNSIVLKVEPQFVDLFHLQEQQGQYELQAGIHYLHIHANLSNLLEQTEFVMDPRNDAAVQAIVRNAQAWCRTHMNPTRLVEDTLSLWEAYVGYLDQWRPDWSEIWQREQVRWTGPGFDSVALPVQG